MARRIGLGQEHVSRYEAGRIPDPPQLVSLAGVYECSVDWLLTGEEARPVQPQGAPNPEVPDMADLVLVLPLVRALADIQRHAPDRFRHLEEIIKDYHQLVSPAVDLAPVAESGGGG